MSLVSTLAKVAAGVMVARTVKGMVAGGRGESTSQAGMATGGDGLQDMLGQVLSGGGGSGRTQSGSGGLQDMLGQVLGGGAMPGSRGGSAQGGGLQDMLGQMLGGGAAAAGSGGLGGILNELSQLSQPKAGGGFSEAGATDDFGTILNQSLDGFGEPQRAPSRDEEQLAGVLIRAMVQAAKSDGRIDESEKKRLVGQLGSEVTREEADFVNAELSRDVDVRSLAQSVPRGAEQQVYLMSAMAIDLDQQSEASYLHELAQALRLSSDSVNAVHDRLKIPRIYR